MLRLLNFAAGAAFESELAWKSIHFTGAVPVSIFSLTAGVNIPFGL